MGWGLAVLNIAAAACTVWAATGASIMRKGDDYGTVLATADGARGDPPERE